ncbi:hypothetical protein IFR05_004780 [Cadophora sp. M221]|nr:hypothetical protein IFR05_004780 [Cadophora sp. M221]
MAPSLLASTTAGAIFGSGLFLSGVYSPSIILAQMHFSNYHMLQTFLAASGCSAIAVHLARRNNLAACPPRPQSLLGLFPYDGNIIGGLLLGAGMTLTGACPGTVLVQIATGIRSGYFAFVGGILGGTLYAVAGPTVRRGAVRKQEQEPKTVHLWFGLGEEKLVLAYEVFLVLVLALASLTQRAQHVLFPPIVGGLLIGVGQVSSLVLTGNTVGVSTGYEQVGDILKRVFGGSEKKLAYNSIAFAVGIVAGSLVLSRSMLDFRIPGGEAQITESTAVLGGFVMVLGARIAGGCTSGHGISGMATFSVASIISVVAMFAGGMGLGVFI